MRATDTPSRRLYKGQLNQRGRFILSYGLGGSSDGKVFPEEVVFLLGLEGQAGRKPMAREKEEQQLPGWEQPEQRRREARIQICHLVAWS